ncbi:MAG TPA: acetylglutamate kinase [Terriglobales bacterium]|nr:acetylglutamate kinase [Terriglobales bacterium]
MRIVLKIGGVALENQETLVACVRAVKSLVEDGHQVIVVHGGGSALTRTLKKMGKQSEFVNGLRVTDAETRDVALMVLAGWMNKALVAALTKANVHAIGLSGGDGPVFRARKRKSGPDLGFVGDICSVDTTWLQAIWNAGGVPVVSSIALGTDGEYYNVNADQMAAACAVACHAQTLIFLTEVAGVLDSTGAPIRHLDPKGIQSLIQTSVITGGMLPKMEACQSALHGGVGRVRIFPAESAAQLADFYMKKIDLGTEVSAA